MKTTPGIRTILLIFFILISIHATPQRCPRGIYDCPGLCGLYVDTDGDGYCDYTLFSEGVRISKFRKDSAARAEASALAEKRRNDSILAASRNQVRTDNPEAHDQKDKSHKVDPGIPVKDSSGANDASASADNLSGEEKPAVQPKNFPENTIAKAYDFFTITGSCLALYLMTLLLSARGVIKKATHRKIWNTLLLLTFLATGLLGIFLTLQLNYGLYFSWFRKLLYWHVEFGIAMAAISIFHMIWHWKYYFHIFKKNRSKNDM